MRHEHVGYEDESVRKTTKSVYASMCYMCIPGREKTALSSLEIHLTTLSIETYSFYRCVVKAKSENLRNSYWYTSEVKTYATRVSHKFPLLMLS